ncbi:hypothetical protein VWY03_05005 [Phaeobacter sp. JH20_09]|uniref:hypothetical protein n=1 Tax=unclassified Phaeobacter TaxID=2621772 RepID=UPI003A88CB94
MDNIATCWLTNIAIIAITVGMMNPAETVIKICGGYGAVASMAGRHEVNVRRWTYAKEKGGTGGLIPSDVQQKLLAEARKLGIELRPEHFFSDAESSGANKVGS